MSTSDTSRSRAARSTGTTEALRPSVAPPYPGRPGSVPEDLVVEPVVHQPVAGPVDHRDPVSVSVAAQRRDRVRWGPVWAGLVVALPTFLLLELAFFALGWLTFAQDEPGTTAGWVSALIGLFSFFLGGATASATAMWRGAGEGLLHGILVWALGVVGIVFLTLFGGGALFGSLAQVFTQVAFLQQAGLPDVQAAQALDAARSGASWAVLGLGLSLLAAVAGGLAGAKVWPRAKDTDPHTTVVR